VRVGTAAEGSLARSLVPGKVHPASLLQPRTCEDPEEEEASCRCGTAGLEVPGVSVGEFSALA